MSGIRTAKRSPRQTGPKSVVMTTRYPLDHPGGVESVARALVDCLGRSEQGWRVSHVTAYSGRVGPARIPLFGDLVAAGRLAARIIGKGDVVLVHGAEYAWGPLAVGRLTRRPVVAVWHGVRASEALPPAKRRIGKAARRFFLWSESLLQRAALQADATVVVSPTVAMKLQSRYGFRGEMKVIPNGVAMGTPRRIGHLSDDVRSSASSNGFPLRVIWVGTSTYQKGLDLAVEACKVARARGQDISLTVVGIPAESAGLEPASSGGWLTWLGTVPHREMDALYRRHDILLFPSRSEACPMTVLEALAAGLPVIGSSVVQWLIEGAGEVVAGEDARAYAEALWALADPERRRRLTSPALERARAFSWESSAAGYLEVLDIVDRQRRHRARPQSKHRAFSRRRRMKSLGPASSRNSACSVRAGERTK
jgi:glycosyltransferase involved in cell wall biosynthesis